MRKRPDQRASQEVRERAARREAAADWASPMRAELVRRATEEFMRQYPDWGVIRDGRWVPNHDPRWMLGMGYQSFVQKYIREHLHLS